MGDKREEQVPGQGGGRGKVGETLPYGAENMCLVGSRGGNLHLGVEGGGV